MLDLLGVQSGQFVHSAYLLGFVLAALACLGAACRARLVSHADPRRALTVFFLGSGVWAGSYVGFLLVDTAVGKHLFYQLSLIVGFAVVWAWLWFCSAYSGRGLHRTRSAQWFAAVVFAVVIALKVTNPWHGLYYELEPSGGPLGLRVSHEMLYWVVMALAYALSATGYLMIYELFIEAKANTGPLAVLTGLTALPAVLNMIGHANASVLDVTHEPLGVAVFAVGLLFVYETQFSVVQLSGSVEDPHLTVGGDERIQGFGGGATEAIPSLDQDAMGRPLAEVLPGLAEALRRDQSVWQMNVESGPQYYRAVRTSLDGAEGTQMIILSDITERKRREQALRTRREKIEGLYETANRLLRASSNAEVGKVLTQLIQEILGYRGVSVRFVREGTLTVSRVAETTFEFMPERPDFSVDGDSAVAEAFRSGETLFVDDLEDAEIDDPNDYGNLRSVVVVPMEEHGTLAVASPEPGAIGPFDRHVIEVLGTYGSAVLDRLDREQALREERDLLDRLIETSPNAIVRLDREGTFVQARGQTKEVLGADEEEILGRTYNDPEWRIAMPEEEALSEEELPFARVMSTGEPVQSEEHSIRGLDGSRRILSVSGAPLRDADGEITETVFHLQNITDQRRRERALRRRREMVESLYDATGSMLRAESREAVSYHIHEVLREVFDYSIRHTGFVEDGLIVPGRTDAAGDLRLPELEPRPVDGDIVAARALQAGEAVVVGRTETLDNPIDYGDLRAAAGVPIGERGAIVVGKAEPGGFDPTGLRLLEVLGSYAALVLERLGREEELLRAKEKAEQARREAEESKREAEAARQKAEKAKEEAENASQMKSSLLANMSHEIRTPLTSIIGFAEAIGTAASGLELPEDSPLPKHANLIEQGGKRLLDTLEGVLNLSKLEAGQMELGAEPVGLATEAERTAEELRPEAREKKIDVRLQTESVHASADEGGIQIVLRNLLSNAIKYTEEGGTVWVRTSREDGQAVLKVEDTGIGMEPSVAERLFEPFRQASEGFNREYEGTGVGLAVTKKAAEQMGGAIEVETEKGEGSRFTVRLPRAGRGNEEQRNEDNDRPA